MGKINIVSQGDTIENGIMSFVADSVEDLKNIDISYCRQGSTCLVVDGDTKVFSLNGSGEWVEL